LRRAPAYGFRFSLQSDQLLVTVFDAPNFLGISVQWAFGAGRQAVTLVSRTDRNWYLEHYFTYHTGIRRMGSTPGQQDRQPASLPEAAGFVYKSRDPATGIVKCFACHSTGPVDASRAAIEPTETGVHCKADRRGTGSAVESEP
jgi:hypothetical protein